MGGEDELGVGSDTETLRIKIGHRSARRRHSTFPLAAAGVLFALSVGIGCGGDARGGAADAGLGASAVDTAVALVGGAPLPTRFEAVSLADAVALASQRGNDGGSPEGARLARLAADLRARLWRFDQIPSDAREAIELYAETARLASGAEDGCDADRRRALLAGELAPDATLT
jgi:N-acetylmuramoyl-L-alanine amidase